MNDKRYVIPEWMKELEPFFQDTGGWPIEELMNQKVDSRINLVVATLQIAVGAQITLLNRLYREGKLNVR